MKLKIIFAVCLMVVAVVGGVACRHVAAAPKKPIYYTCPMHPSVKVAQPGACPICGMNLAPAFAETDSGSAAPCGSAACAAPGTTNQP
ncbi:MAG: Heavy metal binding domain [Verrucomicrobiota bacterium]